jgi:hypothetical protein
MAQHKQDGATTAQLRDDIDRGRTGDKVDFPDPAAAPLGTDEEAAGTPPASVDISRARDLERRTPPRGLASQGAEMRFVILAAVVAAAPGVILAFALS